MIEDAAMAEHVEMGRIGRALSAVDPNRFIAVPARTRDEIGQLAYYIEQMLNNLREVNAHAQGSSETMPGVLHELRDVVKMTEAATVKVLEETEALVEDGKAASRLIAEARREAAAGSVDRIGAPLEKVQALVDTANERALTIMCALEFQDLTSQKVQRAFGVLEEVAARLARIQALVDLGQEVEARAVAVPAPMPAEPGAKSGQDLVDELLRGFQA